MKKLVAALLFTLAFFAQKSFGQLDFRKKIHPDLIEKLEHGPAQMIVRFAAQADLKEAETIADWDARGWFVYRALMAIADATQSNAIAICRAFEAEPQPFWITNMIMVEGNLALAEALARLPEVRSVAPNRQFYVETPVEETHFGPDGDADRLPINYDWGLTKIQADQVWAAGYRGTGIVVAGADTGVKWDHAALKRSYRGWNGTTVDHDYNWRDAIQTATTVPNSPAGNVCGFNSLVPCDDNNHGTHTVGTMTGMDSTSPTNVYYFGIAPDAKWIACRNMDDNWGTETTYAECFQFFVAPTKTDRSGADPSKRPHVVNNSWACPPAEGCIVSNFATHDDIFNWMNTLRTMGTVVVASAGNSGSSCNTIQWPAAIYENAFAVGAMNISDSVANFSSRGLVTADGSNRQKPDIVAPGVSVYSATIAGYASFSGTSMAGPHVAGAVALLMDAQPSYIGNPAAVEARLRTKAVNMGNASAQQTCNSIHPPTIPNPVWGWGRLNAFAAAIVLPVELLFFNAFSKTETIQIDWATASEINADYFLIEKSRDGSTGWKTLQKVAAAGDSQIEKRYQLLDNQPFTGRNFYRLTQFDRDGKSQKSSLAQADFFKKTAIRAYPNPVGDELTLALFSEKNADAELSIFDQNGRLVLQNPMPVVRGSMTCTVAVGDLPSGVYFLRLVENARDILGEGRMVKN